MTTVRVAAVQATPAFLDRAATLDRLDGWTRRAAAEGARLVAFPETWVPGYPLWVDVSPGAALWDEPGAKALFARLWENAVEVPGPVTARLGALAAELRVTLVAGVHERAGRSLYNSLLFLGPDGALANHHRKLVPTHGERLIWGQGDAAGLRAVELAGVRVGGLVCWEHWMPLARQALHDAGEQVHVAAWPGVREMHQVASRHYAFEGRCFVVAAGSILRASDLPAGLPLDPARGPDPDGLMIAGGSAIYGPDGTCLAGPVFGGETLVMADCDLGAITRESYVLDVSGHYARRDVFDFAIRTRGR